MVLVGATPEMRLASEKTFGPVAPIVRFETEDEALAFANGTPFGLAAYFYTRNMARVFRFGEGLEFGMIGLNTCILSNEVAPFGGMKASGLGRAGAQGERGISRDQGHASGRLVMRLPPRRRAPGRGSSWTSTLRMDDDDRVQVLQQKLARSA